MANTPRVSDMQTGAMEGYTCRPMVSIEPRAKSRKSLDILILDVFRKHTIWYLPLAMVILTELNTLFY